MSAMLEALIGLSIIRNGFKTQHNIVNGSVPGDKFAPQSPPNKYKLSKNPSEQGLSRRQASKLGRFKQAAICEDSAGRRVVVLDVNGVFN